MAVDLSEAGLEAAVDGRGAVRVLPVAGDAVESEAGGGHVELLVEGEGERRIGDVEGAPLGEVAGLEVAVPGYVGTEGAVGAPGAAGVPFFDEVATGDVDVAGCGVAELGFEGGVGEDGFGEAEHRVEEDGVADVDVAPDVAIVDVGTDPAAVAVGGGLHEVNEPVEVAPAFAEPVGVAGGRVGGDEGVGGVGGVPGEGLAGDAAVDAQVGVGADFGGVGGGGGELGVEEGGDQ